MMDFFDRALELSGQGFFCSQIMMILVLESEGKENPDLIRAMGGLNGGLGFTGGICGCLTGGCCLLSYFLGKGEPDEMEDPDIKETIAKFVTWFREKTTGEYGGETCLHITHNNLNERLENCPALIGAAFEKCMDLLSERGVI